MPEPTDVAIVDGRRARRERGRETVVDAMLDLVVEFGTPPPVDELARRAGVSVSSVFRYFETLEDLHRHAIERFVDRYADRFEVPELGTGTLEDRVERFVQARVDLHRTVAPIARLARARAFEQQHFAATLGDLRRRQLEQARAHFSTELDLLPERDADARAATVATLTSFESWDQLVTDLGHSDADVVRIWTASLHALVSG